MNHSEHINLGSPVVVLRCGRSEPSSETEYGQDAYLATGTLVISMGKPWDASGGWTPSTLRQSSASNNWAVGHIRESTCLQTQTWWRTKLPCQTYTHMSLATLLMSWLNASWCAPQEQSFRIFFLPRLPNLLVT